MSESGSNNTGKVETYYYDNKIVKQFALATIVWGVVGLLVGIIAAAELAFPAVNMGIEYISFGRLRPLHTNAIIFAFVGNAIFMGVYHSTQRLVKARMYSDVLSKIHFWGWQFIIVLAAVTLLSGITTGKEYAELEWPIDILIAIIWIVFGLNLIMTTVKRRERHIYAAIWWYIASFVGVAMLHVVNSFELPVTLFKSYSAFAGVSDALVQWWYGHNAVAFFLTTPFLGLMYYYLPKAANRPIYSYKLSILHFWSLIFLYMWAGPHHLLYSSLPDWVQSLGVVFSIMLLAPSWGGMMNGLLTLRGAWDKVRTDPMLKFMVVAVTTYGMATFEGPMLSLKNVSALAHYTDWIPAHTHIPGMGWNGFMTFSMLYFIFPRLWNTKLYSVKAANFHFWIGTLGIVFVVLPLYWTGITQGLMWKEFTADGFLKYPNFVDTVSYLFPMYTMRMIGGIMYLTGFIIMIWNLIKTAQSGKISNDEKVSAPALARVYDASKDGKHRIMESKPVMFTVLALVAVAIGGIVEIVPMIYVKSNIPTISSVKPYTPLELEGRDLYQAEGCNVCHTQMVRPFRSENERYGEYSKAGEFVYDRPHLWGSRRTGPDLHRIGGKYPDSWHYNHLIDPLSMQPGSIMPAYPWMKEQYFDFSTTKGKLEAMRTLGVPYTQEEIDNSAENMKIQAMGIVENLKKGKIEARYDEKMVAMIAYLQRLGTDIKKK